MLKKKEEAKLEKRKRRRKKLEKIEESSTGRHMFVDPKYDEQKQKIAQELEEALDRGITSKQTNGKQTQPTTSTAADVSSTSESEKVPLAKESVPSTSSMVIIEEKRDKKKEEAAAAAANKKKDIDSKLIEWMGVGDLDVSSSSSDEEQPEPAKSKKIILYLLFSNFFKVCF